MLNRLLLFTALVAMSAIVAATAPEIDLRYVEEGEVWTDCTTSRILGVMVESGAPYEIRVLDSNGAAMPGVTPLRSVRAAIVEHADWPFGPYLVEAVTHDGEEVARATRNVTYAPFLDTTPPTSWIRVSDLDGYDRLIDGWWAGPVAVEAWGHDDCRFADVEFTLDGSPRARDWFNGIFCCSVGFRLAEEGEHVVAYRGVDRAGNTGGWNEAIVRLDLTPPTVKIVEPRPDLGEAGFYWVGTGGATDPSVVVVACASFRAEVEAGGIGLRRDGARGQDVRWFVDGVEQPYDGPDPKEAFLCLESGEHAIRAVAWDRAGRTGAHEVRVLAV